MTLKAVALDIESDRMIAKLTAIQLIESFSSPVYRSEHLVNDNLIIVSEELYTNTGHNGSRSCLLKLAIKDHSSNVSINVCW